MSLPRYAWPRSLTRVAPAACLVVAASSLIPSRVAAQGATEMIRERARPMLERRAELSPVPLLLAEREALSLTDVQVARLQVVHSRLLSRNAEIIGGWRNAGAGGSQYSAVSETVTRLTRSYRVALQETTDLLDPRQRDEAGRMRRLAMREPPSR